MSYSQGNPEVQEIEAGDQSGPGAPSPCFFLPRPAPGFRVPPDAGLPQPGVCSKVGSPQGALSALAGTSVGCPQPQLQQGACFWEVGMRSAQQQPVPFDGVHPGGAWRGKPGME